MTAQALKKDSLFDYIKFKTYFIPNHSSKQNLRYLGGGKESSF